MTAPVFVKSFPNPELPEKEIMRYARYGGDTLPDMARDCIAGLPRTLTGRAAYAVYPINKTNAGLSLGFAVVRSNALEKNLEGCGKIVLFCATAGVEFDRLIQKYERISPAKALWYQSIGATFVESVCDAFCETIRAEFGETKPRFSPGYGDLPLTLQKDIFAALQPEKHLGVTLGENLFMTPTKSVTAILGIRE